MAHVESAEDIRVQVESKYPVQWIINTYPPGERLLEIHETHEADVTDDGARPATCRLVVREQIDVEKFPRASPVEHDQWSNHDSAQEVVDEK